MQASSTTPPLAPRPLDPGASSALVFVGGLLLGLTVTGLGPHPDHAARARSVPAAVQPARAAEARLGTPHEPDATGALSYRAAPRPVDRPRD